ncbi:MAG: right-handed parallel beta-helix repeat-containing protein [Verrucomicrobiia bacterium]
MKTIGQVLVFILLSCLLLNGKTFYCDPISGNIKNDGGKEKPWGKIEDVISSRLIQSVDSRGNIINSNAPVKAGDTILLRSGWHGVIKIRTGYNEKPITIAAEQGHKPAVGWIEIGEGKNWIIKGLTVSPSLSLQPLDRLPRCLVMLGEGNGDLSSNLVVEDCFIFTELDSSKWTAKDWINARNGIWLGHHGSGHIARNNYVLNTRFGIELCATKAICEGNVVENFSADGIRVTKDGQIVRYNVVKNVFVSAKDGDDNHDDGMQAFLFNVGTGTIRDISVIGNIIIERERDDLPFPNQMQGIGFFDGPLVNFRIQDNVVCVNHWHGITLGDAQHSLIVDNVCYSRWGGVAKPWITVGQKKNLAFGNSVSNNYAFTFNFKADKQIIATNNLPVTREIFLKKQTEVLKIINEKFGAVHPVAQRPRLIEGK